MFLSGCATYKFQRGAKPYDQGYVILRDDYTIAEYTIGEENSAPDLVLAKERFKRRKNIIEDYYKRMGLIENRFKQAFWNPCIYSLKFLGGIFRMPSIFISNYRYEHDPVYRDKIRKMEAEQDAREEERIKKLKGKLNAYIQQDLTKE